jgi:hypothetical protein
VAHLRSSEGRRARVLFMHAAMSPAATITGAGPCEDGGDAGLAQPLLVNGNSVRVHAHANAALTTNVASGSGHGHGKRKTKESTDDKYWVDIAQPEALEPADVESGSRRPLLFRNKRVKPYLLYLYR